MNQQKFNQSLLMGSTSFIGQLLTSPLQSQSGFVCDGEHIQYLKLKQLKAMKRETRQKEEIAKIIQREQVIGYRKRVANRSKELDEEIDSVNSLKSGMLFSQESLNVRLLQEAKLYQKNTALPELHRFKRRIFHRNNLQNYDYPHHNTYLEKEVRQHDNLLLKQTNNHLTTENMKLKTRITNLEKELAKATRGAESDTNPKPPGPLLCNPRARGSEVLSLKQALKNLRRELDEQKRENDKLKFSVKFSRISQLECEREELLTETTRLRHLLEEQCVKRASLVAKEQGLTAIEHKYQTLSDINTCLAKQNTDLKTRLRNLHKTSWRSTDSSDQEKNLSKMLFNAKQLIKEKNKQIQTLKSASGDSINTNALTDKPKSRDPPHATKSPPKRVISKSAQKYRTKQNEDVHMECKNCEKLKGTIAMLENKITELNLSLKRQKENNSKLGSLGQFSRQQIDAPHPEESAKVSRFLALRFQAHHLVSTEAHKYLINGEVNEDTRKQPISVAEIAENLVAEPFSLLSSRYLEVCLMNLFYPQEPTGWKSQRVKIEEGKKLAKGQVIDNFARAVQVYEIMNQQKQQQMFIQVAELVTNYHQHILTALSRHRNGEGTIREQEFKDFFNEIELEKQFVDFITCQIILESLDLQHLNFYAIFQIFYMPSQIQNTNQKDQQRRKFQVDHCQVVKEEDEEYEESKSHPDPNKKTHSRKDDDEHHNEDFSHQHLPHNSETPEEHNPHESGGIEARRNKSVTNVVGKLDIQKMGKEEVAGKELRGCNMGIRSAKGTNQSHEHSQNERYENEKYEEYNGDNAERSGSNNHGKETHEDKAQSSVKEEEEEECKEEIS